MSSTIISNEVESITESGGSGGGRGGEAGGRHGGRGDGSGNSGSSHIPERTYGTGVTVALAAILMLFMALVSAFIVRKGASNDWAFLVIPKVLWLNTVILIASSWSLMHSRKLLISEDLSGFRRWWTVTTALGFLFLIGQLVVWRTLVREGVYLSTNPSSSFFYVFTAAHGLHLLGGLIGLIYVAIRPLKGRRQLAAADAAGLYWHFMDGLWVFIFLLFYLGQ